ncbi:MAG: hypothetical protein Q4Q53_07855 [Methanocorpusculum sp.]|nr:hypothetical protein [Methanocorpusculum sp.]
MSEVSVVLADGRTVKTPEGTVEEILQRLNLNPYEFLAVCEGELLTADDVCKSGDVLKLTSIVHGG